MLSSRPERKRRAGTQGRKRISDSPWVPDISLAAKFRNDITRSATS